MLDFLPPEIVNNILSRLPAKSLVRFTCVCKSWLSLICDFATARSPFSSSTSPSPQTTNLCSSASIPMSTIHRVRHDILCNGSRSLPRVPSGLPSSALYAHGMLIFTKPGQEPSVELLRKERERRLMLCWIRMRLVGEEEAKKLEEEDYQQEQRLLDRLLEKKQAFGTTPFSSPKLPTMDQILTEIEEKPATLSERCLFFWPGEIRMITFPKLVQDSSMLHFEEKERIVALQRNRIALLGEEEAKKLQKEDHDQMDCLIDRLNKEERQRAKSRKPKRKR